MPSHDNPLNLDLTVRRDGPVAVVTLDRPQARNALSSDLVDSLDEALVRLDADESVHVIVLTGAEPGFCAGSDLKELAGMTVPQMVRHEARTGALIRSFAHLTKPLVAAVEGFALGGGFLLATGCDIVVSAEDARWDLPEVRLGWVPPWGLTTLLARVSPATARRLAWGEQPLTGVELHRLGVVDEIAAPGSALPEALEVATRLAALPANAVASTKHVLADAVAGPAEVLDSRATKAFSLDASSDAATTSLTRFARKNRQESTR